MNSRDFSAFIGELRDQMAARGMDIDIIDVDESGTRARLPAVKEPWFVIEREHLAGLGTPRETTAAVLDVYLADR